MVRIGRKWWARKIVAGHGRTISRPLWPGSVQRFPLAYVRTGPRSSLPAVVIPGGPGLASVLPYRSFRASAVKHGLDVIMIEHRGVGLSGRTAAGVHLPEEALTVELAADDVAAVLDDATVDRAVIVGSSYGSYLAQAVAVRHPDRVEALVLDSPILSVAADLAMTRTYWRRLLWEGEPPAMAGVAQFLRQLVESGEPWHALSAVVQTTFEHAGPVTLERLLRARSRGRLGWLWNGIARLSVELERVRIAFYTEPEAVAGIAYRQLGFGLPPDGHPLDPQLVFAAVAAGQPRYAGEPFDLTVEVPAYSWPTVVVSGDRDLRTPPPVAERIAEFAPRGVLVRLTETGHSALDTHGQALVAVIAATLAGEADRLPLRADQISGSPRRGAAELLRKALSIAVRTAAHSLR